MKIRARYFGEEEIIFAIAHECHHLWLTRNEYVNSYKRIECWLYWGIEWVWRKSEESCPASITGP